MNVNQNLRGIACGVLALLLTVTLVSCGKKEEAKVEKAAEKVAADVKGKAEADAKAAEALAKEVEAREAAIEAYIYGYPLVTMEMTRRVMTNVPAPEGTRAPMGQFMRARNYPDAKFRDVTAPNADTLYTVTWVDLSKEPWILSIPDMKGRYFLFPMLDGWTNVFQDPGKRTTGTKGQKYAITGPGWSGTLPAGVTEYKSPTSMVWILGRIYCTGTPDDYKAVHALQDQVSIVPLSSYGKPYKPEPSKVDPAIDMKKEVRDQVNALESTTYFKLLAELMKANPPAAADAPIVAKLAKVGIVPGQDFDASKLDPAVAKGVAAAPKPAQEKISIWMKEGVATGDVKLANGWLYVNNAGSYGTSYRQRAMVTWYGLGANLLKDAIYPTSEGPDIVKKYSGDKRYVVHFEKGQMPPVDGFWSLTMYDDQYFFVDNPLNRYNLSQRNKFKTNADGSVDLLIQKESPGKERESNWLPAPAGGFVLMFRLYWPKETPPSILDGSWKPPEVKEIT
jgi:hypothetical protein